MKVSVDLGLVDYSMELVEGFDLVMNVVWKDWSYFDFDTNYCLDSGKDCYLDFGKGYCLDSDTNHFVFDKGWCLDWHFWWVWICYLGGDRSWFRQQGFHTRFYCCYFECYYCLWYFKGIWYVSDSMRVYYWRNRGLSRIKVKGFFSATVFWTLRCRDSWVQATFVVERICYLMGWNENYSLSFFEQNWPNILFFMFFLLFVSLLLILTLFYSLRYIISF